MYSQVLLERSSQVCDHTSTQCENYVNKTFVSAGTLPGQESSSSWNSNQQSDRLKSVLWQIRMLEGVSMVQGVSAFFIRSLTVRWFRQEIAQACKSKSKLDHWLDTWWFVSFRTFQTKAVSV